MRVPPINSTLLSSQHNKIYVELHINSGISWCKDDHQRQLRGELGFRLAFCECIELPQELDEVVSMYSG